MKKLFLITLILLLQSFPSFGEWKEIYSDDDGVVFIEVDTLRKNKGLIYYNSLKDFYKPHIYQSLSSIRRGVLDCKKVKVKSFRILYYQQSMGRGKVVYKYNHIENNNDKWSDFYTVSGEMSFHYKFLCK